MKEADYTEIPLEDVTTGDWVLARLAAGSPAWVQVRSIRLSGSERWINEAYAFSRCASVARREKHPVITVCVNWSEMEHYSSTVDIDVDDMRENGYDPQKQEDILRYLRDDEESSWKEQCSTADDFYGSDGAIVTNAYRT